MVTVADKKTSSTFHIVQPASLTGRTVTITPSSRTIVNDVTGDEEVVQNSTIFGESNEFFSGNYPLKKETPIFSASIIIDDGYHLSDTPRILIKGEKRASGNFVTRLELSLIHI